MCILMYIYIYTRVYIYILCVYIYIYILCVYIYIYACMHAHIHTSTQAYMHTHPYTHTCTLLYRCIDVCMHTVLCNVPLCGGQRGLKLRELMEKWSIDGCFTFFYLCNMVILPVEQLLMFLVTFYNIHVCSNLYVYIYIHI